MTTTDPGYCPPSIDLHCKRRPGLHGGGAGRDLAAKGRDLGASNHQFMIASVGFKCGQAASIICGARPGAPTLAANVSLGTGSAPTPQREEKSWGHAQEGQSL